MDLSSRLSKDFFMQLPPAGPVDVNRKRGWTHKRVNNARLRSLGWAPKYASFFDAVAGDADLVPKSRVSGEISEQE
jgi:hypothetical protein